MNPSEICEKIERFIKQKVESANAKGVVVGVSGGIDSAVVVVLAKRALDNSKVLAVLLPVEKDSHFEDAVELCKKFSIDHKIHELDTVMKSMSVMDPENKSGKLERANFTARIRMSILYSYANKSNMLVAGTGNKSELALGYFTKFGDGGVDFLPIGDIYKSDLHKIAEFLGIPEQIIKKEPTAGLWEGQTDKDEIGFGYDEIDETLMKVEKGDNVDEKYKPIIERIEKNKHKREMPEVCELK